MKKFFLIILIFIAVNFGYRACTQDWYRSNPAVLTQTQETRISSPDTKTQVPASGQLEHSNSLSDIAESRVKSIVNIASTKIVRYQNLSPFFNDPFFEHFFGKGFGNPFGMPQERRQRSLGSGVIVSQDGHILTNNHVIADASEVLVTLDDQTEIQAKVIGSDPPTDLALLQIDLKGKSISPVPMGNSETLRLAETVLAIGSPFGLGGTVTLGIVSAKGRANVGIVDYEDFIQTDAAINPGNSGGALINTRGELVGINTAIYSKSGGYQGIGFAIPINMAKSVMQALIKDGKVERGWIGLKFQNISSEIAKALKLEKTAGVVVTGVYQKSPADRAGIQIGDVIVKFNGDGINNSGNFSTLLSGTAIGETIELLIKRDGKFKKVDIRMEAIPRALQQRQEPNRRYQR